MTHINERIIKNKLGLLNLASELDNISKACKVPSIFADIIFTFLHNLGRQPARRYLQLKLLTFFLHFSPHPSARKGDIQVRTY